VEPLGFREAVELGPDIIWSLPDKEGIRMDGDDANEIHQRESRRGNK